MGFYSRFVLPRVVHYACGQKPAMKQRRRIIPLASGRVLEIGIGSGLNIPYYDSGRVSHLWGLDPSREAWAIARRNAREHHLDAEFLEADTDVPAPAPGEPDRRHVRLLRRLRRRAGR